MMFRNVMVAGLALAFGCVNSVAAREGRSDTNPPSTEFVDGLLATYHVRSVSLARIENGRIVWTAAYGEQSPTAKATTETLYNIASMTKPITAEVVLLLASRHELSLDESMAPTWVDPDLASDPRVVSLTPRLALSHRTGLPNWRRNEPLRFVHDPGTYGYSGEGYVYVARFVEHRTGERLDQLASELVFRPNGMTQTSYTRQPWFEGRVAVPSDKTGAWTTPAFANTPVAADLMYATPSDYARFIISVMNDAGLTPEIARQRRVVQTDSQIACNGDASVCPAERGMTLGWEIARFGNQTYLMHTGRDSGLFTFGYLHPESKDGLVLFTNSDNGAALVAPILEKVGAEPEYLGYLKAR